MTVLTPPGTAVAYLKREPNRSCCTPVRDDGWIKPRGGLWTTPGGAQTWQEWCEDDYPDGVQGCLGWSWDVQPDAHIWVVDSLDDLVDTVAQFPGKVNPQVGPTISFESMQAEGFDGMWLTEQGQWDTRIPPHGYPTLYGWDLETLLLFDMDVLTNQRRHAAGLHVAKAALTFPGRAQTSLFHAQGQRR